eukprot:TCALIF_08009-PA protein Name:"Protein of unknown function" AED:0.33 eAED:0.33 QI:26/0.66/0.5/0.75/1/1/4/0/255
MKVFITLGLFLSLGLLAQCAPQEKPAVPKAPSQPSLLENFNEVNPDGTYKFGYKASDGTFKSETKDKNGVVTGKYGFIDGDGQLKVVEYSSQNGTGFELLGAEQPTSIPAEASPASINQQQQQQQQFNPQPAVPTAQASASSQSSSPSSAPVKLSPQQLQAFQQAQQPPPTQNQLLTLQAQQNRIQAAQNAAKIARTQQAANPLPFRSTLTNANRFLSSLDKSNLKLNHRPYLKLVPNLLKPWLPWNSLKNNWTF